MSATRQCFRLRPANALAVLLSAALSSAGCSRSQPANAEGATAQPSVLVQTTLPRRQQVPETLTLFGEIAQEAGASENVSFPRPVLLSRLLVSAGQHVSAGQPLLEALTDPAAAASYREAQSAVTLAQKEVDSQQELFAERLTTQAQLAAARKGLADAEAELTAQHQAGASPGVQVLRAPRDAVVASLGAQQGDRVQAGATVLQLSRSGAQRALLGAEPEDISRLARGMPVRLIPVFGGNPARGTVSQVFAVINPQTRLVDVAVSLPDGTSALPGQKVRGDITLAATDAWVLPPAAVLSDDSGAYIYQVAGGHARRVPVKLRVETANYDGVTGSIDPALPVVVSGNYELEDGGVVRTTRP